MKHIVKNICLLALLALPLLASCKDDEEETETKPSLIGTVTFDLPEYLRCNDLVTLTASGITYPEGPIAYKWYAPEMDDDTLSLTTVTLQVPDSIGTFTISASAQYEGYYTSSTTRRFTTVDVSAEGSLKGLKYSPKTFTDKRDSQTYQYVTIGGLDWFAQNLAWDGAGSAFHDSPATHSLFGRIYHWDEATGGVSASGLAAGPQGICPEGWRIPTNEDWADLAKALSDGAEMSFDGKWEGLGEKLSADAYFNGARMWPYSPDNEHTNTVGWNAIPVGNTTAGYEMHDNYGKYGFWWSATQKNADQAYFRYIYCDMNSFPMSSSSKADFGASVRCVRAAAL